MALRLVAVVGCQRWGTAAATVGVARVDHATLGTLASVQCATASTHSSTLRLRSRCTSLSSASSGWLAP